MPSAEQRRRAKYADLMRITGTPLMIKGDGLEEVRQHCTRLWNRGMSPAQIATASPRPTMNMTTVAKLLAGQLGSIHRDTHRALMATRYVAPTGTKSGRKMDSTGVRRRMQSLVADGFGYKVQGEVMGISLQAVASLIKHQGDAYASTFGMVVPVYEKLAGSDPFQYGATLMGVSRAKGVARKFGWVPSSCWDDDTIDDPKAEPEWTGHCGGIKGYMIHLRTGTDPCKRCRHSRTLSRFDFEGMFKLLKEGLTPNEVAGHLSIGAGTVGEYAKYLLGPQSAQWHSLLDIDPFELTARCDKCDEYVRIYRTSKGRGWQCSNKVNEYRAERERQGKDVRNRKR